MGASLALRASEASLLAGKHLGSALKILSAAMSRLLRSRQGQRCSPARS